MAPTTLPVDLRLFGQATILAGGSPVKVAKRATTMALLGFLVLHRRAPVSRNALAYTLFPDETEETALAELRRYLYLTAKALPQLEGDAWIRVDGETVQWNSAAPWRVDVVDFEREVAEPQGRERAVALYTGDLLEELYDDWVVAERERLRALLLDALERLIGEYRVARDQQRALAYTQTLLRLDPWREDIVRAAMSARYEAGDSAGALAEFARFATRLREEMDVAPMPETLAVRDAILRNESLPGAVLERLSVAPETAARPEHLLPFVGRSRELETLRAMWDRAARGHGGFVLVAGEAGIGKTRLVGEVARIVESEGGRVFVGATSVPESMPYQSLVEALRSAVQLLRTRTFKPLVASALHRVLPELEVSAPSSSAAQNPAGDATTLRGALASAALELCRPRPAFIVLEDLHWAGHATFDAIAALARRLEHAGMLLIGTYREEEVPASHPLRAMARELNAEQTLTTLALEPLDRETVGNLVARLDALVGDDAALADRLVEYTEGNALFLNEAIAEVIERKAAGQRLLEEVSPGIASAIAQRVSRLSDGAREVCDVVAVAGQGCNFEVVSEVVALSPSELWAALNELLDRRILREASARSGMDFAFAHHLIAETVYQRIDPLVRTRRHARIAHVLERLYAQRPGAVARELATHFLRGGLSDDAARWFGESARGSMSLHAPDDAVMLATQALDLERGAQRRIELLRLREEARSRIGERSGQRVDIAELEVLVEEGDAEGRFDILRREVLLARNLGESEEQERLIAEMFRIADAAQDERLRAEALRQRATHAVLVSRQIDALEPASEALALFERLGDVAAQVECLGLLVDAETNAGNIARARTHLEAMGKRSATLDDRSLHAKALTITGTAALLRQEYQTAHDISSEVLSIATSIGDRDLEAYARARMAVTSAWLGEFESALSDFRRAREMFATLRNKRGLAITLTNSVILLMRLGLFDEALAAIEQATSFLDVVKERRTVVANGVNASFILLRLGNAQGALDRALQALEHARAISFPVFEAAALANIGNAERALGRLDDAIAHMKAGIEIRRAIQAAPDFADDLSDLAIALADAGRACEAHAVAEELAGLLDGLTTGPFWPHYAFWAASRGFAVAGDEGRAEQFQRRAQDEVRRFAAAIGNEDIRRAFLSIDISQAILSAG